MVVLKKFQKKKTLPFQFPNNVFEKNQWTANKFRYIFCCYWTMKMKEKNKIIFRFIDWKSSICFDILIFFFHAVKNRWTKEVKTDQLNQYNWICFMMVFRSTFFCCLEHKILVSIKILFHIMSITLNIFFFLFSLCFHVPNSTLYEAYQLHLIQI